MQPQSKQKIQNEIAPENEMNSEFRIVKYRIEKRLKTRPAMFI